MKCQKCDVDLKTSDLGEYGFVIIDVCPKCQGAWFDKGELDRLDDSVWTNVEEINFEQVSSDHKDIKCPKCQEKLEPISPRDAKELIVDRCPSCQGFWLDKGELYQMREVANEQDSKIFEKMSHAQRPYGWSPIRWFIYSFKECYFK